LLDLVVTEAFGLGGLFECAPDRFAASDTPDPLVRQVPNGRGEVANQVFDLHVLVDLHSIVPSGGLEDGPAPRLIYNVRVAHHFGGFLCQVSGRPDLLNKVSSRGSGRNLLIRGFVEQSSGRRLDPSLRWDDRFWRGKGPREKCPKSAQKG